MKISSKALRVEQDRINSRHNRVGLFLVSNMSEALSISILPQARKYPRTKKDLLNNHEVEALAVGEASEGTCDYCPPAGGCKSLISLRIFLKTRTGLEIERAERP